MRETGLPGDGFGFIEGEPQDVWLLIEKCGELALDVGTDIRYGSERFAVRFKTNCVHTFMWSLYGMVERSCIWNESSSCLFSQIHRQNFYAGTASGSFTPKSSNVPGIASRSTSRLFWMRASVRSPS